MRDGVIRRARDTGWLLTHILTLLVASLSISCASGESMPPGEGDTSTERGGDTSTGRAGDLIPDITPSAEWEAGWEDLGVLEISSRRLMAIVNIEASGAELQAFLDAIDARIIAGNPDYGLVLMELQSPGLAAVMDAVSTGADSPALLAVGYDVRLKAQRSPPRHQVTGLANYEYTTPLSGSTWAMKAVRAPAAWNLLDYVIDLNRAPIVVVSDDGFDLAHADLSAAWATGTETGPAHDRDHGTAVASVIAAAFDGVGIEGIMPVPGTLLGLEIGGWTYAQLNAMGRLVRNRSDVRVFNWSYGYRFVSYHKDKPEDTPEIVSQHHPDQQVIAGKPETWRQLAEREGEMWRAVVQAMAKVRGDFVIVCAAGNDGTITPTHLSAFDPSGIGFVWDYEAQYGSGCNDAALRLKTPRMVTVGGLALGNSGNVVRWTSSSRGATIDAPASRLPVALPGGGWKTKSGTSFAAPMVAGASAVLFTLDPSLDGEEVVKLLLAGATPAQGGSAPRLDVFGAVSQLTGDAADGVARALADVDDGTVDGAYRGATTLDPATIHTPTGRLGDGCVDMSDARAMRDAILLAAHPMSPHLEGSTTHPRKDLDLSGHVVTDGSEAHFARFDLDGDGKVTAADMDVLASAWGQCAAGADPPRLEGRQAADVPALVDAVDLWFDVAPGVASLISMAAPDRWVETGEDDDAVQQGRALLTVVPTCGDVTVCVQVYDVSQPACHTLANPLDAGQDILLSSVPQSSPESALIFFSFGMEIDQGLYHPATKSAALFGFDDYGLGNVSLPKGTLVAMESNEGLALVSTTDLSRIVIPTDVPWTTPPKPWAWHRTGLMVVSYGTHLVDGETRPALGRTNVLVKDFQTLEGVPADMDGATIGLSPGGEWLYLSTLGGEVWRLAAVPFPWDGQCVPGFSESITKTAGIHETLVTSASSPVSPSGLLLIQAQREGRFDLEVMTADGSARTVIFEGVDGGAYTTGWGANGQSVITVAKGELIELSWTKPGLPQPNDVMVRPLYAETGEVAVGPGGAHVALLQRLDNRVVVIDVASGLKLASLVAEADQGIAWSEDGVHLAFVQTFTDIYEEYPVTHTDIVIYDALQSSLTRATQLLSDPDMGWTHESHPTWAVTLP